MENLYNRYLKSYVANLVYSESVHNVDRCERSGFDFQGWMNFLSVNSNSIVAAGIGIDTWFK